MTGSRSPIAPRPQAGDPRPYEFPAFRRDVLGNGLTVISVDLPGRALVSASLVFSVGVVDEPEERGGATVLAARALSEGTELHDAIALTEAAERLGTGLHAEAGWDAVSAGLDVAASRLEPALALLAEMIATPTFPEADVARLRDERLNDILQARADPRRRADEAFIEAIYSADSPYHRPGGGLERTVRGLDRGILEATYRRGLDPSAMTLIVGGDLAGLDVPAIAERLMGSWRADPAAAGRAEIVARSAREGRLVRVHHRPGSVQTEVRVGHVGLPRATPDFHAISVMSAIVGGMFASRLNMRLREEKGYTYGAAAGFDLRRGPGPFSARAAVNTEVTVPAIGDLLAELARMREERVTDEELRSARDFLVGVFPLRFETPGPVVGSIGGIVVHGLPDDELARYRPAIEAVTADDVLRVAREHVNVEDAAIVLVGDVDRFGADLEAAFGPFEVVRDEGPRAEGPLEGVDEELGPVDAGAEAPASLAPSTPVGVDAAGADGAGAGVAGPGPEAAGPGPDAAGPGPDAAGPGPDAAGS